MNTQKSSSKLSRRGFIGSSTCGLAALLGLPRTMQFLQAMELQPSPTLPESRALYSICGNCVNKCGFQAQIVNGRLAKLNPNPNFPKSRSMLCAKGQAGIQVVYDKDRLKYPLIRTGPRGSGQFRKASWSEALDYTAEKLTAIKEKYGPGGVLFASTEGFQEHFFKEFSAAFGSPNHVRHPSLCLASGNTAFFGTFGHVPGYDIAESRYMIMSGANRLESFITPDTMDLVEVMSKKKAKLIYLDPRYTVTASKADVWLPIKPGTDLAFYLALIHVIIQEELYDKAFVTSYTVGFEEVAAATKNNTPEWAEQQCEIPATQIREIAREFAYYAPRALIYKGRRTSWNTNDTQMRQAMAIANALMGCWDRPGSLMPPKGIRLGEIDLDVWPELPDQAPLVDMETKYPLANAGDGAYLDYREQVLADEPYPVRGYMVYKQNPMHSLPDRARTRKMIEKMEFVAVIDIMPTDTAWLADVILPEDTYLERTDPIIGFKDPYPFVALRQAVVPRVHDTLANFEIMKGLSSRLGFPEFFDYNLDQLRQAQLKPLGISLEDLKTTGVWIKDRTRVYGTTLEPGYRFPTPSGKIELASERFRRRNYDPVPVYKAPEPIPDGKFRMLVGKNALFTHASNQNNPWLHELMPENKLWLNPKPALDRGIHDGDEVIVESSVGKIRIKAWVTERIRPDCVHVPHGFGHISTMMSRVADVGGCDSDLLESHVDKITGNAAFHETLVTVEPTT